MVSLGGIFVGCASLSCNGSSITAQTISLSYFMFMLGKCFEVIERFVNHAQSCLSMYKYVCYLNAKAFRAHENVFLVIRFVEAQFQKRFL